MSKIKNLAVVFVIGLLAVVMTGCETQAEKREKVMKEYATKYFENHLIGIQEQADTQATVVEITIDMLKRVNELKTEEQYDLTKLFGCKAESYVDLTINTENQTIDKYEFHLDCD